MHIVVAASDEQWNELTGLRSAINWQRVTDASAFNQYKQADAFFSLNDNSNLAEFAFLKKPVFIHAVVNTLADMAAPPNVYRINGWVGFLSRTAWEMAGEADDHIKNIFNSLNIQVKSVKDEPGFISARIIAMIINEAYFAVEDNVSSKAEIDTAMKLGTNYPHGPFEWTRLIGAHHILTLLQKLNETDARYKPSALLIKEVTENI